MYTPRDLPSSAGGQALGFTAQSVIGPVACRPMAAELPLLRDEDEGSTTSFTVYSAAAAYTQGGWIAAILQKSSDRVNWTNFAAMGEEMGWGLTQNTLGSPASPWAWDTVNTLTVRMVKGGSRLASATDIEVLNGANAGALLLADGSVEIIQWATVTPGSNNSYTLSRLLRGRRGTDHACGNHASPEAFYLLETNRFTASHVNITELDTAYWYRLVGHLDSPGSRPAYSRTLTGVSKKPYSPVHVAGTRDGSQNLSLSWIRRTRYSGALRNLTGTVPVGETSEAYEVDILNGSGTVVRTITGLSSPAATYSAADQTTDFGSPQATVNGNVYQISEEVGRGYPRSFTV